MSSKIFLHIFTKTLDEMTSDPDSETLPLSTERLHSMASDFASYIPEEAFLSPAEVQGFLMRHRDDPLAALSNAASWATEVLEVKEKGKNVADFDNEIKRGGALFTGRGSAAPPAVNGDVVIDPRNMHRSRAYRRSAHPRAMPPPASYSHGAPAMNGAQDSGSDVDTSGMPALESPGGHRMATLPGGIAGYANGNGVVKLKKDVEDENEEIFEGTDGDSAFGA